MQRRSHSSHSRPVEGRTSAATLTGLSSTFLVTLNYRFNREAARSRSGSNTIVVRVGPARDILSSRLGSVPSKHQYVFSDLARLLLQAHERFEYRNHYTQTRVGATAKFRQVQTGSSDP